MTEEKFKIAKELNARIKRLSFELSVWESNVEIISLRIKNDVSGKTTEMRNNESLVNFQPIKEFIIKELSEKLDVAKSEFDKL